MGPGELQATISGRGTGAEHKAHISGSVVAVEAKNPHNQRRSQDSIEMQFLVPK